MQQFGDKLIGKIVATVEASDSEVLVTFDDGSEIAVTLSETGGDYSVAILETAITTGTSSFEQTHDRLGHPNGVPY